MSRTAPHSLIPVQLRQIPSGEYPDPYECCHTLGYSEDRYPPFPIQMEFKDRQMITLPFSLNCGEIYDGYATLGCSFSMLYPKANYSTR
jgi:hypothetical protein